MNAILINNTVQRYQAGLIDFPSASLGLIIEGCTPEEVELLLNKLPRTRYFLNTDNGDIYSVNYMNNVPYEKYWVEISEKCYKVHGK